MRSPGGAEPKDDQTTDPASVFTSSSVDRTGSLMGWLDDETPFSEDLKAAENADLPDWLNEETPQQESAAPILPDLTLENDQPAQAADLPDWLQEMAPPEAAQQPAPAPVEPLGSADDMPSWLQDETEDTASGMLDFASGDEDDMADLLSGFGTEDQPAAPAPSDASNDIFSLRAEEKESSPFPFGGDLPIEKDASFEEDILIGTPTPSKDAAPAEDNSLLKNIPLGNGEDLPDWLAEDSPADTSPVDEPLAAEAPPAAASPFTDEPASGRIDPFDSSLPFEEDTDLPDWLTSEPTTTEEASSGEGLPAAEVPAFSASPFLDNFPSADEPSFDDVSPFEDETAKADGDLFGDAAPLANQEAAPAGDEHPFAADNLPDWLESEEASQIMPEQPGTGEAAENLSPAQLPGWLAAMRPVKSVAIENEGGLNEHIEKSGPLAGLRGVLPVDRQAIKYRKPPVYSVKLKVSETQAAHAGLMEDLLQRENKPSEAKRVGAQGSKRLMQLVVALVLIVVLVLFRGAGSIPDIPGTALPLSVCDLIL